jgi:hypothetical protein
MEARSAPSHDDTNGAFDVLIALGVRQFARQFASTAPEQREALRENDKSLTRLREQLDQDWPWATHWPPHSPDSAEHPGPPKPTPQSRRPEEPAEAGRPADNPCAPNLHRT